MTVSDVFCLRGSSSAAPVWQLIFQKQPDVRFVRDSSAAAGQRCPAGCQPAECESAAAGVRERRR